jgi:cellulose synthase/poly-beta-1,6-N-acetylglucosamine synthase-like glycosyltransferase
MISFIVPAYNEEVWIGRCISAIHSALASTDEPYEVIVVDDGSRDATASMGRQQGAQVICVEHRQIAATRNAGARQAQGDSQGRFAIPAETVVTSGRKLRAHSFWYILWGLTRLTLRGPRGLRNRRRLEFWYEPEREKAKL